MDVELSVLEGTAPEAQNWSAHPTIGALPNPTIAFEVPTISMLFPTRPRSGVIRASDTDLTNSSGPEPLLSKPATPPMYGFSDAAPSAIQRPFRTRPRAAVDAGTATIQVPDLQSCGSQVSSVSNPVSVAPTLSAEVVFVDRLYRGRPRNPVANLAREFMSVVPGDMIATAPVNAALPTLPVVVAERVPVVSERMFRGRPRTGVLDAALASSLASSTEANALLSPPAKPALQLIECEPVVVDRMFRMRPRAAALAASGQLQSATSRLQQASKTSTLRPHFRHRVRRHRRLNFGWRCPGACSGGAPGQASRCRGWRPVPPRGRQPWRTSPKTRTQSLSECAPAVLQRLFRFRPKVGVDCVTPSEAIAAEFAVFPAGKPEFRPDWWDVLHGAKPHFVNKMYRMRIKQAAEDPETVTQTIRSKHLPSVRARARARGRTAGAGVRRRPVFPRPALSDAAPRRQIDAARLRARFRVQPSSLGYRLACPRQSSDRYRSSGRQHRFVSSHSLPPCRLCF